MTLEALRDRSVQPYEGGRTWGTAGAYEWVTAVADFAVDPLAPANAGITDLDLASRDESGRVRFEADLRVLRPTAGGNGKLLLVIPNRGLLMGVPFSLDAPFQFGTVERLHPGDGFLLERGWTIAWVGWQWDVLRAPGQIGLTAPEVDLAPGWLRIEFRPDADQPDHAMSDSSIMFTFADYPTADLEDPEAVLYERLAPDAEPVALERERWRFTDATTVELDSNGKGFQAFHWYTLIYRSARAPVTGAGLLAVRDTISYLRRSGSFDSAFGFGISQSGRLLRQFLREGHNLDEEGRVAFDGVFAHIAGGRIGEFNHRYAQPAITHVIGFSNLPPYDTPGLLARQRAKGGAPKLVLTNSSWEYWRGDGALVHVDAETGADLPEDPDSRTYLLRGTDHMGAMPFKDRMPVANPVHKHDDAPLLRAIFVALEEWVSAGARPPPSDIPRWADGTAATRKEVLARFGGQPEVVVPDVEVLNVTRAVDLGPDVERGIGRWPLTLGEPKAAVVSAVDADGNETAGVALPAVSVPVAAYTGWNPRQPTPGLPAALYEFVGSTLPLLSGRSLPDRTDYEAAARAAARTLVDRRLLLDIDAERTVAEALRSYDKARAGSP